MIPARRTRAVAAAKARRRMALTAARKAFRAMSRERTPAAVERAVETCRLVVAADDALESLGVPRG